VRWLIRWNGISGDRPWVTIRVENGDCQDERALRNALCFPESAVNRASPRRRSAGGDDPTGIVDVPGEVAAAGSVGS
jgi:hypothetical protein